MFYFRKYSRAFISFSFPVDFTYHVDVCQLSPFYLLASLSTLLLALLQIKHFDEFLAFESPVRFLHLLFQTLIGLGRDLLRSYWKIWRFQSRWWLQDWSIRLSVSGAKVAYFRCTWALWIDAPLLPWRHQIAFRSHQFLSWIWTCCHWSSKFVDWEQYMTAIFFLRNFSL